MRAAVADDVRAAADDVRAAADDDPSYAADDEGLGVFDDGPSHLGYARVTSGASGAQLSVRESIHTLVPYPKMHIKQ